MNNVIEIKNLTKKYKNIKAIDNISFDVKKGEILGLLGPNGSGKSTTINCLLSLLKYEGSIKIFDEEMSPNKYNIKQKIGVVFQDVAVFDELTVVENIDYFCGLYIKDKIKRKRYVDDAIKLVKLEDYRKFYPKQLSGGEMNRIEFEKIHLAHYDLLLGDELFASLDQTSKIEFIKNLKKYVEKENCYCLIIIHDKELEQYFDEIYKIENQQLTLIKTSNEIENYKNDLPSSFKVSMLFYKTFYKNKLLGNKKKYLFYSIIFSLFAS